MGRLIKGRCLLCPRMADDVVVFIRAINCLESIPSSNGQEFEELLGFVDHRVLIILNTIGLRFFRRLLVFADLKKI